MPIECRDRDIAISPANGRLDIHVGTDLVATTEAALAVAEPGQPVRYYVPVADVRGGALVPSATRTTCPFKGEANYFDLLADGARLRDAVWTYADPCDQVAPLAGHVAFWGDAVRIALH